MKKIMLYLLILLILSGCTANYDLVFEDGIIEEKLDFTITNNDYQEYINQLENEAYEEDMYKFFDSLQIPNFVHIPNNFHKKESEKLNDGINLKFTYKNYEYDTFNSSYLLNDCFYDVIVLNEENEYYLNARGPFDCPYDNVKIRIKTDKKVINTNAKYEDGFYTWEINKDNFKDLDLIFHISKIEEFNKNQVEEKNEVNYNFGWIIILTITISILFVFYKKMNNKL